MINSIRFSKLHPDAKLPSRGSTHAAGLDLYCIEDIEILARTRVCVRTGVSVAIPLGFYGRIAPRSGLAVKHGLDVLGGVVDSDYRGEVICVLINHGDSVVNIQKGSRVAQLIIESIITPEPEWAEELNDTERDVRGLGSTGLT